MVPNTMVGSLVRIPNRHGNKYGGNGESALSQSAKVELEPNTMIGSLVRVPNRHGGKGESALSQSASVGQIPVQREGSVDLAPLLRWRAL